MGSGQPVAGGSSERRGSEAAGTGYWVSWGGGGAKVTGGGQTGSRMARATGRTRAWKPRRRGGLLRVRVAGAGTVQSGAGERSGAACPKAAWPRLDDCWPYANGGGQWWTQNFLGGVNSKNHQLD